MFFQIYKYLTSLQIHICPCASIMQELTKDHAPGIWTYNHVNCPRNCACPTRDLKFLPVIVNSYMDRKFLPIIDSVQLRISMTIQPSTMPFHENWISIAVYGSTEHTVTMTGRMKSILGCVDGCGMSGKRGAPCSMGPGLTEEALELGEGSNSWKSRGTIDTVRDVNSTCNRIHFLLMRSMWSSTLAQNSIDRSLQQVKFHTWNNTVLYRNSQITVIE